jgi:hypothetical protein
MAAHRSAPPQNLFVFWFGCVIAARPTLVVKISDTSHWKKAGSNPAFDVHVPWKRPRKAVASRAPVFPSAEEPALSATDSDFACSPACVSIVDASHRQGGGEDVCYFVVKA